MRTRSTIAQAHTSEWLGTFGAPGNGTPEPELQRACLVVQSYLKQHNLPGNRAMVRLDGYYGLPKFVNQIQEHQLGYLLRSRDYGLLEHQSIQARLEVTPGSFWSHPECHQVREVFDLGPLEDSWTGYTQPVRLIVVRTPHNPKRKHRIGKKRGDFIYELFITDHSQNGLSGCDLLSLYYGRGGFEKLLGDEDREQDCDLGVQLASPRTRILADTQSVGVELALMGEQYLPASTSTVNHLVSRTTRGFYSLRKRGDQG